MVDHLRDATKKVDLISREAAVQYIKDNQCKNCSDIGLCGNCAVLVALKLLENVPAADVRPVVRARWERVEKNDPESNVICTHCKEEFSYIDGVCYVVRGSRLPHFCPNCGADMREVTSGDTRTQG